MNPAWLYLIGTIATWVGWVALGLTLYRLVLLQVTPPGIARSSLVTSLATSGVTAALAFVIAAAIPMKSPLSLPGIKLPLIWVVMPFAAWAAFACLCFGLYRGYQVLVDPPIAGSLNANSQRDAFWGRIRQGVFALVLGAVFYYVFKRSGDSAEVITGSIPFNLTTAISILLLAIFGIVLMAIGGRAAKTRGLGKIVVAHIALLIGSVVFGLPFAWLVITSFKEDQDMSSANGLVWIPKVSETVPYRDPADPLYESEYKGQRVQAAVIEREPGGLLKLDVQKPMALRGATFEARPDQLTEVDRRIAVVTAPYEGQKVTGKVIKELDDGHRLISITQPAALFGTTFTASPADVEAVRHVGLRWQNYPDALDYLPPEAMYGLRYLRNTLVIVFFAVLGTTLSSSIVAYAFSRLKFPGKNLMFTVLISTMMLPAAVTLLPTFLIFKSLGWIDTLYPLWVPAFFASAFNVFLLRQFFMSIPKELEDASKIDGCSYFVTFWRIMLPQVKPALAVIAIWTIMGVWNNFMGPLVYINSPENMPISYALQLYQGQRGNEPGLLMAFATLAMIPVLLLFFFAQRYFIEGVTLSGMGGR